MREASYKLGDFMNNLLRPLCDAQPADIIFFVYIIMVSSNSEAFLGYYIESLN